MTLPAVPTLAEVRAMSREQLELRVINEATERLRLAQQVAQRSAPPQVRPEGREHDDGRARSDAEESSSNKGKGKSK